MMTDESLQTFLDQLASRASTPGGGSAAGLMGAMGAALVSMVCNLTLGKEKHADVAPEMAEVLATAERLRAGLTDAIAADIAAFDAVMAAYGLAKATEDEKSRRTAAIQVALKQATEAPLDCARLAAEVISLSRPVELDHGKRFGSEHARGKRAGGLRKERRKCEFLFGEHGRELYPPVRLSPRSRWPT